MLRFLRSTLPTTRVLEADAKPLLARTFDFPSISEAEAFHRDALKRGKDIKGMFTSDRQTIAAVESVIDSSTHPEFIHFEF